jgi:hypothetical protein
MENIYFSHRLSASEPAQSGYIRAFTQWKILSAIMLLPCLGILITESAVGAEANLSWNDNSSTESGFRIERSSDGQNFSHIVTVGTNATTYSDTGLQSDTTYWYRVNAYNEYGESGYTNITSFTTEPDINEPPTISSIVDQSVKADSGASGAIPFTVGDPETDSSQLLLSASSSNEALIPNSAIQVANSISGSSVSFIPGSGQSGTSIITILVTDGTNTVSESFQVDVIPVAVLAISEPANGSDYYLGDAIQFSPSILGGASPSKVSYYINGTLAVEVTQSPFTGVLPIPATGTLELQVVADLSGGGQIVSDVLTIDVQGIPNPTNLIVTEASGG